MADAGVEAADVLKHTSGDIYSLLVETKTSCVSGEVRLASTHYRSDRKKYFKPDDASKALLVPKPTQSISRVLANMYSGDWVGFLVFFRTSLGINSLLKGAIFCC